MKALARAVLTLLIILGITSIPCFAADKIRSLCEIHYPTDYLYEWDCVKVTGKDSPYRIFGKQWQDGLRFNRMDRRHFLAGMSVKVPKQMEDIKEFNPMPPFYLDAGKEPKVILIDQNEMYLGAYEFGTLVFSAPVAVGVEEFRLKNGSYRVDAVDPVHESSLYPVEGSERPYPMHYGLRFHVEKVGDGWTSYWIHGRDLPGYPASHGCIGLYDEEMQLEYYGEPAKPLLMDAKKLYNWAVGDGDTGALQRVHGPMVIIMGEPQIPPEKLMPVPDGAASPEMPRRPEQPR
ncbi:hypothetical protein E4633_13110 [Geomonas terrae]|uniref:L,D-TPase catalytic domain-containing protein n=1 Tax=Geomonas terrae TaxID=2562681 RepID=A0A4S1CCX6_9BACT|nr:L,D-transpeptidase [Geomonas terrae]TGU71275.1 hypothetical protein E4633_13110 [Geomonas terrae]